MQADPSSISGFDNSSMIHDDDSEGDASEVDEFDQLESDSEEEVQFAPEEEEEEEEDLYRVPGNSLLPADVVEKIIDVEGVTGNLAMSKEALFTLSVATEEFIKKIVSTAELQTSTESRSLLSYKDVASVTEQYQEFFFIRDTIPPPLTIQEALLRREEKQRQLEESDPALLTSPPAVTPPPSVAPTKRDSSTAQAKASKAKGKTSKAAGTSTKEKKSRSSSSRQAANSAPATNGMKGVVVGEAGAETPWTRWLPPGSTGNTILQDNSDPPPPPPPPAADPISDSELNPEDVDIGPNMYNIVSENSWAIATDLPDGAMTQMIAFGPPPTSGIIGRTIYTNDRSSGS